METHTILGGKVQLYRRQNSSKWQCRTYLAGRDRRATTKESSLGKAKDFAEDWYLDLIGKQRSGDIRNEKTFRDAANQYLKEYPVLTEGARSAIYLKDNERRLKNYLIPFFGSLGLSQVTAGKVQEYRVHRQEHSKVGRPPARSTMHQEIVTLRQVLKTALRHGWTDHLPDLSTPYKTSGKIGHRAWFSHEEYRQLYTATRKRRDAAKGTRWEWETAQLHDFVLFMANTGLRPDEMMRLEHRDITIYDDEATGEEILEIVVRGKRGVGYCKSTKNAVRPYRRLRGRNKPKPTDLVFPSTHRELFNTILDEESLKFDREGNRRTAYSLRHSYISFRLMEGADIYQIAKNCRTSVEMIEKHYAVHIKTNLDAAAINVRRAPQR